MTTATLDGFPLTGPTPGGGIATTLNIDGWLGRTLRRSRQDKAQQPGSWPSVGNTATKTIVITGQIQYESEVEAAIERRQILALGGVESSPLQVIDAAGPWTRMVEVDAIDVTPVHSRMVEFSIAVAATDPLVYGPDRYDEVPVIATSGSGGRVWPRVWPTDWGVPAGVTPGAVSLLNNGTASYFPRVQLAGYLVNPVLTVPETGDWVHIGRTIAAGQPADINWGEVRRVTLGENPISIREDVTYSGNFLAVPVGGASLTISADDASTDARLRVWSYEGASE